MIAFVGLLLVHLLGAAVRHLVTRCGLNVALRLPSSALFGVALFYALALGPAGLLLLGALLGGLSWLGRGVPGEPLPRQALLALAVVAAVVLARPWVPTQWDEFVWLAKARFGAQGFSAGLQAALDPAQQLIPAGYPPLWPLAVGWLALGLDALDAHVLAASLLVLLCVAVALEAWSTELARAPKWAAVLVVTAPLVLVHARSTYVDLPVGLLGVALLGFLLAERPSPAAVAVALVATGFKDEGLAHVVAASLAAAVVRGPRRWAAWAPLVTALIAFASWRLLVRASGVAVVDHAFAAPAWGWTPRFAQLLALHAADLFSWGLTWAVVLAALVLRALPPPARALRLLLLGNLALTLAALLVGPERVRVFAENGTLLNRFLVQLWPAAALLIVSALPPSAPSITSRGA